MTVSVVMLTFNRPQFIDRAIRSVVEQDYQDWELIIVDDGKTSETEAIVGAWTERDTRIGYFHRLEGGNIANATNFGLRKARGKYISILDDDDFWIVNDKLSIQVAYLEENTECAACGGGAVVLDRENRETLRYFKPQDDASLRRVGLLANPILHSTSMFRRELIFQCGMYDETLPGFQDWDVFLKLGKLGELRNLHTALISYTIWDGGGSFRGHKENTGAALRIILRNRGAYPFFHLALFLGCLNYLYARFPVVIKRASFSSISRLKKSLFSSRLAAAKGALS